MTWRSFSFSFLSDNIWHVSFMKRFTRWTTCVMLISIHDIKQPLLLNLFQVLWISLLERSFPSHPYSFIHLCKSVSFRIIFLLPVQSFLFVNLFSPPLAHTRCANLKDFIFCHNFALFMKILIEWWKADWTIRHSFHKNKITE